MYAYAVFRLYLRLFLAEALRFPGWSEEQVKEEKERKDALYGEDELRLQALIVLVRW